MARAFVFCIGGTGERVMKSITMLMASGMSTEGFDIVPIVIDHHDDLDERKNLNTLIDDYRSIYKRITTDGDITLGTPNGFFSAKIENIDDLMAQKNHKGTNTSQSFGSYIGKANLNNDINDYLIQTLYSTNNLNDSLKVGFRGSPNVGTLVLDDQMCNSDWYDAFCRNFDDTTDRVFIISSIFGGTGASGFPLLEKLILNNKKFPALKNAHMGALTVMPYYGLGDPKESGSRIDSADFMTKAKSALVYYADNILTDNLYYIGEPSLRKIYPNNEKEQRDAANFTELVGATAFFHFLKQPRPKNGAKSYYTRAIKEDVSSLNLKSLGDGYKPLVKTVVDFLILGHLVKILPEEKYFPLSQTDGFDEDFYQGEYQKLVDFFNNPEYGFDRWYNELATNDRAFAIFSLKDGDDMAECVQGDVVLDAEDESYYLLSMIENVDDETDNIFRNFLSTCYNAITEYTQKITE